ncbi:MAG TPA: hypothetical protein GXX57_02245 [Firmicutes bacterium]|jgi:hypothetical protein|nr:hypothetical protein [Bacillota bacterium]
MLYLVFAALLGIYIVNLFLTIKQYIKVRRLRQEKEIVSPKDVSYLSMLVVRSVALTLGLMLGGVCLVV